MRFSVGTPPSQPSAKFIFVVDKSDTRNTAYAWAPSSLLPQGPVSLTLLGPDGTVLQTVSERYTGHIARFFTEIFNTVTGKFTGSVILESGRPLYLTVLRLERLPSGFTITAAPPDTLIK